MPKMQQATRKADHRLTTSDSGPNHHSNPNRRHTRRQMLDYITNLKLPSNAEAAIKKVISEVIAEDGTPIFRLKAAGHWTTDLGSRQLERSGGSISNWELVITVFVTEMANTWNGHWTLQGNKHAKSRNDDRKRATVAVHVMPTTTAVFRSPLRQMSQRWKALFGVLRQLNPSGLYAEMEEQRLIS